MLGNKIKAIIFDMDGVLIDAKDWHYDALNKALGTFGININRHDHLTTYDGLSTSQKLNMLSKIYTLPTSLHSFINEMKQQYTMDIILRHCKPIFHHQYALSKLKEDGYKLAVASNSVRNTVSVMMEKSGLDAYLEFSLSNQDVIKEKPDPEIYVKAIDLLDLTPKQCIIVEDNENGLKSAYASGANVLKVDTIHDVTYERLTSFIQEIENEA